MTVQKRLLANKFVDMRQLFADGLKVSNAVAIVTVIEVVQGQIVLYAWQFQRF